MPASFIANATSRLASGTGSALTGVATQLGLLLWDAGCTVLNAVTPNKKVGTVTPKGCPGEGGKWPEYVAPKEGDSRCSCPALNAMANHGILPRDGKNITFKELGDRIHETYNFAGPFCYFVPNYIAQILTRTRADKFNLADIDVHNGIEHDASLIRHDTYFSPDQGKPAVDLIENLLNTASGPNNTLTAADVSRHLAARRAHCKATNPQYSQSFIHKMFGSSNASTMLLIMGGRIEDLRPWLIEERIPEGWESRYRTRTGLTIAEFNKTVLTIELGVDQAAAEKALAKND